MSTDRAKRDVPTAWIGGIGAGLMLYALSIGPACWIAETMALNSDSWLYRFLREFYAPLVHMANLTQTGHDILLWYASLFD